MADQNTEKTPKEPYIVCQRIRFFRERKGMEQKEVAAYLGIHGNSVCNWENGRTRPDISQLPKLCELLGVSIDELFNLPAPAVPEQKPVISVTKGGKSNHDDVLLEKYHRLSKGHQVFFDSMLDKMGDVEDEELCSSIIEEPKAQKQLCAGYDPGLEFDDIWDTIHLYKEKVDQRMDCIFPVSGDSMEPDFHDGDLVMVQRLHDNTELQLGEIGAFICGNETYIKQYSKAGLRSLNKKYKMMRFTEEERVFIIGRVLGVLEPEAIVDFEDVCRYEKAKKRIEERETEETED